MSNYCFTITRPGYKMPLYLSEVTLCDGYAQSNEEFDRVTGYSFSAIVESDKYVAQRMHIVAMQWVEARNKRCGITAIHKEVAEGVRWLLQDVGIKREKLARIFGVQEATIVGWSKTGKPKKENLFRVLSFVTLLRDIFTRYEVKTKKPGSW